MGRNTDDFSLIPVHTTPRPILQTKLMVNSPGDVYELEADRVAEQVMRMPEAEVQREYPCGGSCDDCEKKRQMQSLQMKGDGASSGHTGAPVSVNEVLRSPGQPLDAATRAFMEPRFGMDFSHIRTHSDRAAAESARQVNARAYTVGNQVVFGDRQFSTGDEDRSRLLAHELVHTVQQPSSSGAIQRQLATEAPSDADAARPIATLTSLYGVYVNRLGYIAKSMDGNFMALINPNRHHFVEITWDATAPKLQSFIVIDDETWSISNWNFATNRFDTQESHVKQEVVEVKLSFWERLGNSIKFSGRVVEGIGTCAVGTGESLGFGAYAACAYGADVVGAGYRELQGGDPRTLVNQAVTKGLRQFLSPEMAQKVANYGEIAANAGMLAQSAASARAARLGIPKAGPEVPGFQAPPKPPELAPGDAEVPAASGVAKGTAPIQPGVKVAHGRPPALEARQGGGQGSGVPKGRLFDTDAPTMNTAQKGVKVDASHPIFKDKPPVNDPPVPPQSHVAKVAANTTRDVPHAERIDPARTTSAPGRKADPARMGKKPPKSEPGQKKTSGPPAAELDPGEGDTTKKPRRHRGDADELPRKQKISDQYDKPELEQSPELIARLPEAGHRRLYMAWLKRGHVGKGHPHINPATDLDGSLRQFSQEEGIPLRQEK